MVSLHSLIILFIAIQLLLQPAPAADFLLLTPANKRVYDTWYDDEGPKAGLLSEYKVIMGLPHSTLARSGNCLIRVRMVNWTDTSSPSTII